MADADESPTGERKRGKTVHGEAANAGHRVLAPDDAEVEAYLETALNAASPDRSPDDRPAAADPEERETVVVAFFGGCGSPGTPVMRASSCCSRSTLKSATWPMCRHVRPASQA